MKAFLMHQHRDFDLERELPPQADALIQDLELNTVLAAMAAGDPLLHEISKRALLQSLKEPDAITYRQQVLGDCPEQPTVVRELYALAGEALNAEKSVWGGIAREYPRTLLSNAVQKMELFVGFLRRLRKLTDDHAASFTSLGFRQFFGTIAHELDEDYFELVQSQLEALRFKGGMLISAGLGRGNKGRDYVLRRPRAQRLLERVFDRSGYSFTIPERDESGFRAYRSEPGGQVNASARSRNGTTDDAVRDVRRRAVTPGERV